DFVLYSVGEVSVLFVAAQIFEGQDGDRTFLRGECPRALVQPGSERNRRDRNEQSGAGQNSFPTARTRLRVKPLVAATNSRKQFACCLWSVVRVGSQHRLQ